MIYRSYYAFMRNPMHNSAGMNTSTIFAFALLLDDVLRKEKPSHVAIIFDPAGPNFRHELYDQYKANRQATPEEIKISVPYIKKLATALNIPHFSVPGFEADDVIGTLVKQAELQDFEVYMVSPDKDLGQLVSPNIFQCKPVKGSDYEIMGETEVCEKFGVKDTKQIIDLLALWGDSSDNVPGAPGVGEKTACKLLAEYESVENILDHTNDLKGKLKETFTNFADQIRLSKTLVTIRLDVPITFNEDEYKRNEPNISLLTELFQELEFKTLLNRYTNSGTTKTVSKKKTEISSQQTSLFPVEQSSQTAINEVYSSINSNNHNYQLVNTPEKVTQLVDILTHSKCFCFDTETTGLDAFSDELVGFSFSIAPNEAWYVPCPILKDETIALLNNFKNVFENNSILKVGHNLKFDILFLSQYEIQVCEPFFDTMLAHYLIQPELSHKMDNLSRFYLNYTPVPIESLIGSKGPSQKNMREVAPDIIKEYAAEDADVTLKLYSILYKDLINNNLEYLFNKIEMPLMQVLCTMEKNGVILDVDFLNAYAVELKNELLKVEQSIYELCGCQFNISSPKQLGEVLFDKLKIDSSIKKTKSNSYPTGEEVLIELTDKHPVVELILEYRSLNKLIGTYVEALPKLVNPKTQRVHTSFNQALTSTGRLSSSNPNFQNIPIREERGREIRKAFISSFENGLILAADYSQVELRIMAHMSKDQGMIDAFFAKQDIHSATAAKIYNVPIGEVTREQRRRAKTANFGIIYGISVFGLSQRLKIPRKEASEIIDGYFKNFPGVKSYMTDTVLLAREKGYAETILNRRRYLPDLHSANANVRGNAERTAINAPIQGSAADIMKLAMVNIALKMKEKCLKSKMILQVHDELVFDVYPGEQYSLAELVKHEMENAYQLDVPLDVEVGIGKNWFDAH
jgi:DNA polymerase-1